MPALIVNNIDYSNSPVKIYASIKAKRAKCPVCEKHSNKIHDHYIRTISDLPLFQNKTTIFGYFGVMVPPLITEIKPKFKQKDFMNSPKIIGRILLICYCWIILRYTKRLQQSHFPEVQFFLKSPDRVLFCYILFGAIGVWMGLAQPKG